MDRLIAAHIDDLRAFVRLQVHPKLRARESHSDFVQSICLEVLEDLPGFEYRGPQSFRAWLFTLALNKVRQKHQHHFAQKRDPGREAQAAEPEPGSGAAPDLYASICSPEPSPSQHAVALETAEQIEAAMDLLPSDHHEVLILARLVGLSYAEIAERMDRSESAVRTLLSRACVRLLASLEGRA